MKYTKIIAAIIILLLIICPETSFASDAESVLKQYLQDRIDGKYRNCGRYISMEFYRRQKKNRLIDCYSFLRDSEIDFKSSKIVKTHKKNDSIIFFVDTKIEDPTSDPIFGTAKERYEMILENGKWKINDWTIEYK